MLFREGIIVNYENDVKPVKKFFGHKWSRRYV
jgi:hypothetical protein